MTAKGELERLDQLGRDAAGRASRHYSEMNSSNGSYTGAHAAFGAGSGMHWPTTSRAVIPVALFLVLAFGLSYAGVSPPGAYALAAVILFELAYLGFRLVRRNKNAAKAVKLQSQLHQLKQQEFELRYEEAKQDGQLDGFKGKK